MRGRIFSRTVASIEEVIARFTVPDEPAIDRVELAPWVLSAYNKEFWGHLDPRRPGHPDPPVILKANRRVRRSEAWVWSVDGDKTVVDLQPERAS